jgi:5'-phosphate synthase pdxT subunit
MPVFGVLALQGDFAAHAAALRDVGVPVREVRRARDVAGLSGLALPGGESSTLLNLMQDEPWFPALERLHEEGGAFLGTCAGAILLAREVQPAQPSLGFLDATVVRNAYGRQVDSFQAHLDAAALGEPLEAIFIRAPRFRGLGPAVEVLARLGEEPVLIRQGRVLAATFHPELTRSRGLHRLFVQMATARPTPILEPTALLR